MMIDLSDKEIKLIIKNLEMNVRTYSGFIATARVIETKDKERWWRGINENNALIEKLKK